MSFIEWVQTQLNSKNYDAGEVDGIFGRRTRNALIAFQKASHLKPTGMADADTVALLRVSAQPVKPAPSKSLPDEFPWMAIGLRKKGLREGTDALRTFLKSDGKTLGDPAKLPWCGDFAETCIATALPNEILPVNPYFARNWAKWGTPSTPSYGDVLVFERGPKNGHVGFYYAEDKTHFHVLGGNQSNQISVARVAKSRLLASRAPLTGGPYRSIKVQVAANGAVSTNEA